MASGQSSQVPQSPPQGGAFSDPGRNNPHMQKRPVLTKEEIQVIEECNTESFWKRCLPIGLSMAGGTAYLIQTGYLKRSPRWGMVPKSLGALFVGYMIGKLSYQSTCQDKILRQIPQSNLAQSVRKRRGMISDSDSFGMESDVPAAEVGYTKSQGKMREVYSSMDTTGDTENRNVKELDDNLRPSMDREAKRDKQASASQATLTYDELRLRNRQEYEKGMAAGPNSPFQQRPFPGPNPNQSSPAPSLPPSQDPQTVWDAPEPKPTPFGTGARTPKGKNQYGDIWEE